MNRIFSRALLSVNCNQCGCLRSQHPVFTFMCLCIKLYIFHCYIDWVPLHDWMKVYPWLTNDILSFRLVGGSQACQLPATEEAPLVNLLCAWLNKIWNVKALMHQSFTLSYLTIHPSHVTDMNYCQQSWQLFLTANANECSS